MRYGGFAAASFFSAGLAKNDWLLGLVVGFLSTIVDAFLNFCKSPNVESSCRYFIGYSNAYTYTLPRLNGSAP